MTFTDILLVILLATIVIAVIYFSFIKNKGNPCWNCPYSKNCNKAKCKALKKK